jgi:hypothetical protein
MASTNTIYRAKKAASLTNPITNAVPFVTSDSSTVAAAVYFPQVIGTTSAAFRIRARGRSTTGTSGNSAVSLQFGNSVSASTNTIIYAPTTQTNAANCVWFIEAICVWDATKQQLETAGCCINGSTVNYSAYAAGTTVTAVDLSTGAAGNSIVVAGLFGTSNASNNMFLDELSLEVL